MKDGSHFGLGADFRLLAGIVVLAVGARLALAVATTSWVFPSANNWWEFGYEMGQIAASIAAGKGFAWPEDVPHPSIYYPGEPTAWMPPVYPYLMAAAFAIFGIFSRHAAIAIEIFQTALSALSCIALYFLGKRVYNAQAGLIAALLLALYPPAIHFAVEKPWSTTLFSLCSLLVLLMFLRCVERPRIQRGAVLGLLLGFTALVDPVVIATYPFIVAWYYVQANGDRSSAIKTIAAAGIAFFLSIAPWIGRNYAVFGQFVMIKSNLGNELFKGNNEYATGHFSPRLGTSFSEAEQEYLRQSDEVTRNRFLFGKALAFIREHPARFAELTWKRFIYFWTFAEKPSARVWIPLAAYFGVLALAGAGILLTRVKGKEIQLLLIFLLTFPLPYYFTIVGLFRYRFPLEPLLLVIAAYALQQLARRWAFLSHRAAS